jgi:hypothetical protein
MHRLRHYPGICCLALAIAGSVSGHAVEVAANANLQAFAQAENAPMTTGVRAWTRDRLVAAKKRWAQNQQKFADCSAQLAERKKTQRMSLHAQGHFLQDCMIRKP